MPLVTLELTYVEAANLQMLAENRVKELKEFQKKHETNIGWDSIACYISAIAKIEKGLATDELGLVRALRDLRTS